MLTGFHGLMRLSELVWPDRVSLRDYWKMIAQDSVQVSATAYQFYLPGHKADRFFDGNTVILQQTQTLDNPLAPFLSYLASRD